MGIKTSYQRLLKGVALVGTGKSRVEYGCLTGFMFVGILASLQMSISVYSDGFSEFLQKETDVPLHNSTGILCIAKGGCVVNSNALALDGRYPIENVSFDLQITAYTSDNLTDMLEGCELVSGNTLQFPTTQVGYSRNITLFRTVDDQMQDIWEFSEIHIIRPIECDDCVGFHVHFDRIVYIESAPQEIDWIIVLGIFAGGVAVVVLWVNCIAWFAGKRHAIERSMSARNRN